MSKEHFSKKAGDEFAKLVETVETLRGPNGCPWDKKQNHNTLKKYLIEECYEVLEAIEHSSSSKLCEELGDVLLQVLIHSEIARQDQDFDISDVCQRLREKLIRRHPHVFGDIAVNGVDEVLKNWEQIKSAEAGYEDRNSILDGIPFHLPALMRANEVAKRASKSGFDWSDISGVINKLQEEIDELKSEMESDNIDRTADEIGDLLFTVANLARFLNIDPEEALRKSVSKFSMRFKTMEQKAFNAGMSLEELSPDELDQAWEETKQPKANNLKNLQM